MNTKEDYMKRCCGICKYWHQDTSISGTCRYFLSHPVPIACSAVNTKPIEGLNCPCWQLEEDVVHHCGTCKWFTHHKNKKAKGYGTCSTPYPDCIEAQVYDGCGYCGYGSIERFDVKITNGTFCDCWEKITK